MNPVHAGLATRDDPAQCDALGETLLSQDRTINVLILEDQPLIRRGIRSMLGTDPRIRVCGEASDRSQAMKMISSTAVDVVVMELNLASEETISLIRQIRELDDAAQVVVLSRFDESTYALPAFKAGARAFVMKNEEPGAVLDAIRSVARGSMRFSWEIRSQLANRAAARRPDRQDSWVVSLSPRELEVVSLIAAGLTSREIASRMRVSIKTVEAHRAHIKQKANLGNGAALIRYSMAVANEMPSIPV